MYKVIVNNLKEVLYKNKVFDYSDKGLYEKLEEKTLEEDISSSIKRINKLLEKNYYLEQAFLLSCYLYKCEQINGFDMKILDLNTRKKVSYIYLWNKLDLLDCLVSDVDFEFRDKKTSHCFIKYKNGASYFEQGNIYMVVPEHLEDDFWKRFEHEIELPKAWVNYFAGKPSYEYLRVLGLDELIPD